MYLFFNITLGVIMGMDFMECFLHALRLQWVEFQGKFYKDDDGNLNLYRLQFQSKIKLIIEEISIDFQYYIDKYLFNLIIVNYSNFFCFSFSSFLFNSFSLLGLFLFSLQSLLFCLFPIRLCFSKISIISNLIFNIITLN